MPKAKKQSILGAWCACTSSEPAAVGGEQAGVGALTTPQSVFFASALKVGEGLGQQTIKSLLKV